MFYVVHLVVMVILLLVGLVYLILYCKFQTPTDFRNIFNAFKALNGELTVCRVESQ